MDERVHRALDGELADERLTDDERAELAAYRRALGEALAPVRGLPAVDLLPALRAQLAPAPAPRRSIAAALGDALRWLWAPRAVTLRPAVAVAGLALVAAAGVPLASRGGSGAMAPAPSPAARALAAEPTILVPFRLSAAGARRVALMGDFTGWQPTHELREIAPGAWAVDVPLVPGVYDYVFVIDGTAWRLDPLAPQVTDGFGGASSRVAVQHGAQRS